MSRRVAITGATGLIGRHVAARFRDESWRVAVIVRPGSTKPVADDVERVESSVLRAPLVNASIYGPGDRNFLPLFQLAARGMDAGGFVCGVEKAARALGVRPRVGLREGLAATAAWYRGQGLLSPA